MSKTLENDVRPPKLLIEPGKGPAAASVADLIEWFLIYDERTSRIRHPHADELFKWKQASDEKNGSEPYPFENAESRFAIGVFQALQENNSAPMLSLWLNDVLAALHDAKNTKAEIVQNNRIDESSLDSALQKAQLLTTELEKRLYLSSCWMEILYTAEARILGWCYQEIYGTPFTPTT